ncbi:hypothetical protein N7490_007988 [Penicillium lividum]|nr:hypothetical protein N7490_007988 [Penicillium lividum]
MDRGVSARAEFFGVPLLMECRFCAFAPVAIIAAMTPMIWVSGDSAWSYNYGELILEVSRPLVG